MCDGSASHADRSLLKSGISTYLSSHAAVIDPEGAHFVEELDREILASCDGTPGTFVTPSLIEYSVLDRCGYFESFPHQLLEVVPPSVSTGEHAVPGSQRGWP